MQKITPFLWFENEAEEAMNFYLSVFKDSKMLNVSRFSEGGPAPAGTVMVASFEINGMVFNALNTRPSTFDFNESVSFMVNCDGQEEVDYYWSKFLDSGGQESMCGWLKDKFGVSWQIVPKQLMEYMTSKDMAKAGRAMQAMMTMKKIDLAVMKKAFDGE